MAFALPLAATAVAAAAPAVAATAAKVSIMAIAKSVLMNVAISAAMSALQPQVGSAGKTFEWTLDPNAPIPFAAGRVGVAGTVAHLETYGPDKMYYGFVSVLSGAGPVKSVAGFKADDEVVTFDGNGKAVSSQWAGEMWLRSRLGTQPDTALTNPPGLKNNAQLPGWSAAHKLSGKACYMLVLGENSKRTAYPTGEPKPLATVEGLFGWDPRQDSTYPGGAGACRLNNPATWVWLDNPILWALKWSLGLWEGPVGKGAPGVDYQVGGIGASLEGIDVPAFVAAANVADANGWKVAAYPTTDDDKAQVLDGFLQAGGAIYSQRAGKISCIQRAAPRASVVTISAADTAGPLEIDTAASRIDRINTIRPRFWSEAHRWQMTAIDEVSADAYRTEDGAVRPRGIDYAYVPLATQAAQLAGLQIANTREGIAGTIPLKPHLRNIVPGTAFTITEPGFLLDGLKCLCLNSEYDPLTGIVSVTFVSETDAKYPFALGQSSVPPAPAVLTPFDPFVSPPSPDDWSVVVRPGSAGGGRVPGFDVVGSVDNATATGVLVEWGATADGPWSQAYLGPPTVERIPLTGIQPGQEYFVAVQNVRGRNYSARQVYGPFTAPELVSDDTMNVGGVASDLFVTRMIDVEALAATTATQVSDLETIYGDTASAAASAAAAALSEAAAILSAAAADTSADTAATQAGIATGAASSAGASASAASTSAGAAASSATASASSAAASQTSRLAAEAANTAAGTSASAAATSASAASGSASGAGSSAAAANTSATNAATSAGSAATSATAASGSATTAAGHASTASTAATNAATSAGLAGGSATAASGSASSAATSATNAGNSATAAAASQVAAASSYDAARAATSATLPRDFSQDGRFWTSSEAAGSAENAPAPIGTFVTVSGEGRIYQSGGGYSESAILPRAPLPMIPGTKWRFKYRARYSILPGGGEPIFMYLRGAQADFSYGGGFSLDSAEPWVVGASWATCEGFYTVPSTAPYPYFRPEVRGGATGAGQVQVAYFEIQDVTASSAAGASASAAATQASNAATSATAAGTSATAASGSATTASTQAGLSLTYAGQSSTSASGAAASAVTAGTAATTATSAAATASTQASNASASAASASSFAGIAASVGGSSINPNPYFAAWPGLSTSDPVGYGMTQSSQVSGRVPGSNGRPNAIRFTAPGAGYAWLTTDLSHGPGYFVVTTDITFQSGTLLGVGLQMRGYNLDATVMYEADDNYRLWEIADINGSTPGYGVPGRRYTFSKMIRLSNANIVRVIPHLFVDGYYTNHAKTFDLHGLTIRPASAEEIAAGTVLPTLSASVAATQTVVADLATNYALARYTLAATTPGGAAILSLSSSSYGTVAGLAADKIYFGENTFFDDATDTLRTTTGGNVRVIALGASFGTDGQLTEWEGPAATSFAAMSRANAYFYKANVAPFVGGSAIAGAGFTVSQSHTGRVGTRLGAGAVTTSTVTLTPSGHTGTVTYAWTNVFGDSTLGATAATSATTAFNGAVAANQQKQAQFAWTATDSGTGKTVTGYVAATILDAS